MPFDYDPDAPDPERWLGFLDDLWRDDEDSQRRAGEWFGYVLCGPHGPAEDPAARRPDARRQGRDRARARRHDRPRERRRPDAVEPAGDFGLAPLIGKPLAVVSDARLNGRDSSAVVERLLSISGEDRLTVNIKYREQWTGTLPRRLCCSPTSCRTSATPPPRSPAGS